MIERQFISQKTKEYHIQKYIESRLQGVGISQIKLKKIPLGEKIIISAAKPSLIVGSKGANIRELTAVLKTEFKLENPQIEIAEIKNIFLDAKIVAQRIVSSLERFGSARFKSIGHKIMENIINSGALGVEIIISGKIPSSRAKNWRFYQGYLKKCGDLAINGVRKAKSAALLKSGVIGVKVAIMPPDLQLPDKIEIVDRLTTEIGEVNREVVSKTSSEDISKTSIENQFVEENKREEPKKKEKAVARKKTAVPRKRKLTEASGTIEHEPVAKKDEVAESLETTEQNKPKP